MVSINPYNQHSRAILGYPVILCVNKLPTNLKILKFTELLDDVPKYLAPLTIRRPLGGQKAGNILE